jgi:hypothetical protein
MDWVGHRPAAATTPTAATTPAAVVLALPLRLSDRGFTLTVAWLVGVGVPASASQIVLVDLIHKRGERILQFGLCDDLRMFEELLSGL